MSGSHRGRTPARVPESSPPCDVSSTQRTPRPTPGHSPRMTIPLAAAPVQACGCGEEQIPWMLTKYGLLGTAAVALATLVVMLLAGWLLATGVWLLRRRRERAGGEEASSVPGEPPSDSLGGFTWGAEEP